MSLIKLNNKLIKLSNKLVGLSSVDPYNPLGLPPYTIRLKYKPGTTPTFSVGTGTLVDAGENIWDLTYENSNWRQLLYQHTDLLKVLGANTTGVTNMGGMFESCSSLTSVSLFDTSSVIYMTYMFTGIDPSDACKITTVPLYDTSNVIAVDSMFFDCITLTSIPLFNTSKVKYMQYMFKNCINVESGALALYQQASTQANPPIKYFGAFSYCGMNTETGAAELAQIPLSWKDG